jgi:hypothetical protein
MTQEQEQNRINIAKNSIDLSKQLLLNFEDGIGKYTVELQEKAKEGDIEARNPKVHKNDVIKRNVEY